MREYLSTEHLDAVRDVVVANFALDPGIRPLLFEHIDLLYVATLPVQARPDLQIGSDLMRLNRVERLVDGSVPLQIWLHNAVRLTREQEPRAVLEKARDVVTRSASGEPDLGDSVDLSELKEEIIFQDDTLAFGFLTCGASAGLAVGRILVCPYRSGAVKLTSLGAPENPHSGTCWLIADDIVVTNHHVVNARSAIEGPAPHATDEDLVLQGANAVVRFDYDTEQSDGVEISCAELLAWDARLDYAVLRLRQAANRPPLSWRSEPLQASQADNIAVNVIQHPDGLAKRVGLRNNIVYETTAKDVRYFTDTRNGSSGSPVLTDGWAVCALHRGARRTDVKFQGKTSAYINVGTQISAIIADVQQRYPTVYAALHDGH